MQDKDVVGIYHTDDHIILHVEGAEMTNVAVSANDLAYEARASKLETQYEHTNWLIPNSKTLLINKKKTHLKT